MSVPLDPLPLSLLTGCLGSGKTTLLAALLRRPGMGHTAVIVNEYGETSLDGLLIGQGSDYTVTLPGGCLCCAPASDLVDTLLALHERRAGLAFERVVIETSGLADPLPILRRLGEAAALTERFVLEGVITTVDAIQGERELGRAPVSRRQVAVADRILLTKGDIAARAAVARLQERLRALNPDAPLIVAAHGAVEPAQLFGTQADPRTRAGRPLEATPPGDYHGVHHHAELSSFCLEWPTARPWSAWQAGLERLALLHGEQLLRVKGLVGTPGDAGPTVIQGVRDLLYPPTRLPDWPDDDRRSRLVFITERLPASAVRVVLDGF